ncbi:ArnT family glycosyltransferase [Aliiruegeria sabulilitoris]|uniref:ArnT family glycosyltransferase n=1 Tax=Aliiruegeria sabulilitoris TaxID=1510458 RepID=UPI000834A3FC|nr:hypothetical protein [Aliiruegeria sabulilitoris]NDR59552.1 hypothetical protein [Pseudoruegeria sp. M32A2M]
MYSIGFFEIPSRYLPILVTVVLVVWVISFQGRMLHLGALDLYDEFYTLDRTTGFARHDDWLNVYRNNEVSFRKPPLQYWFGAFLLEQGYDWTFGLRAPSMAFALGCLIATAFLAAIVLPANPWVIPVAVLFLTVSRRFWISASQALLDTGVLFFLTVSLVAAMLALRRPVWWYLMALAVGLGALQKAPVALIFVTLFLLFTGLTARWHPYKFRSFVTNRHFLISVALALAISASWYVFQIAQHGLVVLKVGFGEQMFDRFVPTADVQKTRNLSQVIDHLLGNEEMLRWCAVIALALLPWRLKRYDLLPLPMMLVAYLLAVGFADGGVSPRYTLYFASIFAVSIAAVLLTLPIKPRTLSAFIVMLALAMGGPVRSPMDLRLFPRDLRLRQIEMLERISAEQDPSEQLVYCNWDPATRIPPGAVSVYGTANRPYFQPEGHDGFRDLVENGEITGPMRGLCPTDQLQDVEPYVNGFQVVETLSHGSRHYTYWTADSVRTVEE